MGNSTRKQARYELMESMNQDLPSKDNNVIIINHSMLSKGCNINVANMNNSIRKKDNMIHIKSRKDNNVANMNKSKDNNVVSMKNRIPKEDNNIDSMNHIKRRKESNVANMNNSIPKKDNSVTSMNHIKPRKDNNVASMSNNMLSNDNNVPRVNHSIASKDNNVASMSNNMTSQDSKLSIMNQDVHNRNIKMLQRDMPNNICKPTTKFFQATNNIDCMKLKVVTQRATTTGPPIAIETEKCAEYHGTSFNATATVEVPALRKDQEVQIGWVQACADGYNLGTYGNEGVSSCELPEVASGKYKMIADSTFEETMWYDVDSRASVIGPTNSPTFITVSMEDHPHTTVPWKLWFRREHDKLPGYASKLTNFHYKQMFYAFLVAELQHKAAENQSFVLHAVNWSTEMHFDIDAEKPIGKRSKLLPTSQARPCVMSDISLPTYARQPPCANDATFSVWRPFSGEPHIMQQPKETTMDIDEYLRASLMDLSGIWVSTDERLC